MTRVEVAAGMRRLERQFMTPRVFYGGCWTWVEKDGSTVVSDMPPEEQVFDERQVTGWFAELSAAGYMDRTGLAGPFKSSFEAETYLVETFDTDA